MNSGGMGDLDRIMDRLAAGEPAETATRAVTRSGYAELTSETVEFLRRNYNR
jgi:hypothetical protein